ncbi:Zn-ribbon domain-containing OB-fold protein [Bordetella petrii]|uniref:Zn-ribbon domain-containing OB-fold protein n=1 Tax=Bordetella petrii TaxID=94624 RepID=A0ABT7W9V1_9BORD|nr:Zn-ribbon domain-containing OB-fold protein [Bordetella petrii]MDM9561972.1 Zn-ribbon domain-containing OB-fold protein [Bordetella petrii]
MNTAQRPVPQPTDVTRPYWEAAAAGRLVIQECRACGARQFYPRGFCVACLSDELHWLPCSGKGTVYTYTINHRAPNAHMKERLPYIVAAIDLDEGTRMIANIVDSPPQAVAIGARVEVVFEALADGMVLPQFRVGG